MLLSPFCEDGSAVVFYVERLFDKFVNVLWARFFSPEKASVMAMDAVELVEDAGADNTKKIGPFECQSPKETNGGMNVGTAAFLV